MPTFTSTTGGCRPTTAATAWPEAERTGCSDGSPARTRWQAATRFARHSPAGDYRLPRPKLPGLKTGRRFKSQHAGTSQRYGQAQSPSKARTGAPYLEVSIRRLSEVVPVYAASDQGVYGVDMSPNSVHAVATWFYSERHSMVTTTYKVTGMSRSHCANAVASELRQLGGVTSRAPRQPVRLE